jgi:hypothetical protein
LKNFLDHALIKIKNFDNKRLKEYLTDALEETKKSNRDNFYSRFFEDKSSLVPNEHLLMPVAKEIKAIYVDSRTVLGIDHAFEINPGICVVCQFCYDCNSYNLLGRTRGVKRLCAPSNFHVISQDSMLSWHFAIYIKLERIRAICQSHPFISAPVRCSMR